jgi:hypothetical protein
LVAGAHNDSGSPRLFNPATQNPAMRVFLAIMLFSCACAVRAQEVDYEKQVKPVLQARCYACHGALKQESDLRLDTVALMKKGGASGTALISADVAKSELLGRISSHDDAVRMPPEGEPLTGPQVDSIKKWLEQGAPAPENEEPERDPREHWAFRTPMRPAIPNSGLSNPIDAFLEAKRADRGLVAQGPAEPQIWLRRIYLDLIGLPPTAEQLENFAANPSADVRRKVIDDLLNSPQYGERWGRHWMDIWRYSDWWGLGAEVRNSQKHIWHWRDWIIESLNADKGYDQMIREMLAADELYPNDLEKLRAGGFLARQYFIFNRTTWLDGAIEHTSKGFLGVTLNCCKCHDHKYDPFSQEDYYRFRAIFEPYQVRIELTPGVIDSALGGIPHGFDCNLEAQTQLHIRGDDRNPDSDKKIVPGIPALLGDTAFQVSPIALPREAHEPGLRDLVIQSHLNDAEIRLTKARESKDAAAIAVAQAHLDSIRARIAAQQASATGKPPEELSSLAKEAVRCERLLVIAQKEQALQVAESAHTAAEEAKKPELAKKIEEAKTALAAASKALETLDENYTRIPGAVKTPESNLETPESRLNPFPATSTGRRSALANWITDRQNPLAARVAVNHIWTRHFGRPLTPSLFDLGRKSAPPEHQELLDWLAVEFMESGWSMKHLHRLMLTSQAYERSSSSANADPSTLVKDPENRFYWRANSTRMEAQVVRDSLLSLGGEIDLTMGGPTIDVKNETSRRRSLYFFHSHNENNSFLETFDDANVLECYRRSESIVPQQALALENSKLAMEAASKIAARLPTSDDASLITTAFTLILATPPTPEETSAAQAALVAWRALTPNNEAQVRARLVLSLLNHNDFVTIR